MDCKMQCLFVSASGGVFLFFLAVLCAVDSETLYVKRNNRLASTVALFFSSFLYMGIFFYLYHDKYIKNERRNNITEWIDARRTVASRQEIPLREMPASNVRFAQD